MFGDVTTTLGEMFDEGATSELRAKMERDQEQLETELARILRIKLEPYIQGAMDGIVDL